MKQLSIIVLIAAAAGAQPRYNLIDLGVLKGGNFSQGAAISDNQFVSGLASVADGSQHAMIWYNGRAIDISKPGVLGPNSGSFGINSAGQAAVLAESTAKDPNNENFCAYGTGLKCLPFQWQGGLLTPLPLLGGNNGTIGNINNRGEIVGVAETGIRDPQCPTGVSPSGTGPHQFDYQAVVWGPRQGEIRVLRPLAGDTVGVAIWLNDLGQAVGASGTCANTVLPPLAYGPHAVLWDRDGTVHDLGNLGSSKLNMALSINNTGDVVGGSALSDDSTVNDGGRAFLWTKDRGKMINLGTLPGDKASAATGINDRGEVAGISVGADGNPRAFIWRNGVMTDLNTLVPENSPLYLLFSSAINNRGEIAGFGVTEEGDVHAYLLQPNGR